LTPSTPAGAHFVRSRWDQCVAVVGRDPGKVGPQLGAGRLTLGCFDRCPAHEPRPLLGDRTTMQRRVGLAVSGREPGSAAQVMWRGEPPHVADLGHEDRAKDLANAGDLLDGLVAGCIDELTSDVALEDLHLALETLDQVQE